MEQFKRAAQSWLRTFLAASLTVALAQLQHDQQVSLSEIGIAGLVAVLPVIIRWLDKTDKAFGRGYGTD